MGDLPTHSKNLYENLSIIGISIFGQALLLKVCRDPPIYKDMEILYSSGHVSNPQLNLPLWTFNAVGRQIPHGLSTILCLKKLTHLNLVNSCTIYIPYPSQQETTTPDYPLPN